jgi:hypothetical protein
MKTLWLCGCLAAALLMIACAHDPKPGTPDAAAMGDRYMHSMSDPLAQAKSFTFDTSERLELIAPTVTSENASRAKSNRAAAQWSGFRTPR